MRHSCVSLIAIFLLGLALRLFILSQRGSLWFDEAFSAHFASMDLSQIWHYLRFENNPPFYFILLHFWMKIFGNSELAIRSLSMVFGLASIPLIYLVGMNLLVPLTPPLSPRERETRSRVRGERSSAILFAAFLASISTFTVFYSAETRMYALYEFLALVAVLLFLENQESGIRNQGLGRLKKRFNSLILYSLFIILSLLVWTHLTAWLIIAAFLFYLFWQSKFQFRQFIIHNSKFIILGALLVLQFLPWLINFIQIKFLAQGSHGVFFYIPPDKNFFLSIFENFLALGQENAFIITILSAIIVLLGWLAIRKRDDAVKFLLSWLFIPLLVGFAFSNANPRYFIASAPAFYLLLGIGFSRAVDFSRSYKICRWGIPLILFTLTMASYPTLAKISHYEWDKLARWVEQKSTVNCELSTVNCIVLINPHSEILPFERYYQGELPMIGIYPKEDSDDRDLRIVKTNWVSLNTKENIRVLADITKGYNYVFLVSGGIDPIGRNIAPTWFWENGWMKTDGQEFGRLSVVLLEK